MRLFVYTLVLILCQSAFAGETVIITEGKSTTIRILGFSVPSAPFSVRPCRHGLNDKHIVNYVWMGNKTKTALAEIDNVNRNIIKTYNAERLNPIENQPAANFAAKLLETHSKTGIEAAHEIYELEDSQTIKNAPIVNYVMALIDTAQGESDTNTRFAAILRECPFFWSARRAEICQKLEEINVLAAAAAAKSFYLELKIYIEETQDLKQLPNNGDLLVELLWLKDTAQRLGSGNEQAMRIVKPIFEDEDIHRSLSNQHGVVDWKQREIDRVAHEEDRLKKLLLAARNKYRIDTGLLQEKYLNNHEILVAKNKDLSVYELKAKDAEQIYEAAEARVERAEDYLSYLEKTRYDVEDYIARGTEIRDQEKSVSRAEDISDTKHKFYQLANKAKTKFYNEEVKPLVVKEKNIIAEHTAFMNRFRIQHAEAIANARDLKQKIDEWERGISMQRRQIVGNRQANLENRVQIKEAKNRQQREEAMRILTLVDFDVSKQLTEIQRRLAK